VGVMAKDGWIVAVNEKGEEDWTCPKCGSQLTSCCGNSHIWCYSCGYTLWSFSLEEFISVALTGERVG